MKPIISVIIPCYNQGAWLEEALRSVEQQTYTAWECIIVNDGSSDTTEATAQEWTEKDNRFTYCSQPNQGVSAARNHGIRQAKGTYILPLDADDTIGSNYIEAAIKAFEQNPDLSLVYCKAIKFGAQSGDWELPEFSLKRLARSNIIFNAGIFKRTDWERIGGYDERMKEGLEDWEFWIHLLKDGGAVLRLPSVQFYYRTHATSRNTTIDPSEYKKLHAYITKKHIEFFIDTVGSYPELLRRMHKLTRENEVLRTNMWFSIKAMLKKLIPFNRKSNA
ncbi:glycosyltransferase family 2 protein [Candidatus Ulvibacter alkanivorans]|uniref:glycosyltransferase family 2 protein n=1 Tax=Candidatus Ulvibacter alkanivorans TaxID=2267620 RepID=UPI000DF3D738|nr:glycosyltransferase family A protein [Candidatus Ulvibacter alkanivorans]